MEVLDFFLGLLEFERAENLLGFQVTYKVNPKNTEGLKKLTEDYNLLMDMYFGIITIKDHIKNGTKFGELSKKILDQMLCDVREDIELSMEWLQMEYGNIIIVRHHIEKKQQFYYELLTLREKKCD